MWEGDDMVIRCLLPWSLLPYSKVCCATLVLSSETKCLLPCTDTCLDSELPVNMHMHRDSNLVLWGLPLLLPAQTPCYWSFLPSTVTWLNSE